MNYWVIIALSFASLGYVGFVSFKQYQAAKKADRKKLLCVYAGVMLIGLIVFVLNNFVLPGNFLSRFLWGATEQISTTPFDPGVLR